MTANLLMIAFTLIVFNTEHFRSGPVKEEKVLSKRDLVLARLTTETGMDQGLIAVRDDGKRDEGK